MKPNFTSIWDIIFRSEYLLGFLFLIDFLISSCSYISYFPLWRIHRKNWNSRNDSDHPIFLGFLTLVKTLEFYIDWYFESVIFSKSWFSILAPYLWLKFMCSEFSEQPWYWIFCFIIFRLKFHTQLHNKKIGVLSGRVANSYAKIMVKHFPLIQVYFFWSSNHNEWP